MRILAIRGRNLASLAGDFVVDFEAEPLAEAGIFAITGPTGAGKSTLLDAMCLALFGTLPRMSLAQASARIETGQGDNLAADDPRLILRHGTGEGFAEVDFIARDGVPYRARWSVQRARKQPRGKLQNPIQSFQRLDTEEMLGSTRTETLGVIQHVVGLSADQFRRAVLLAQGDFDAFLRAKADERALLLERLTGSGIYARLGAAAYEKASRLQQQLQALENQIADQNGLDDAARAALEAEQTQVRAEAARLEAELAVLAEARRWHARKQELAVRLAEAEAELERACAAQADAEMRRQALSRRQRAFELAHLWQEAEKQRKTLAEAILRSQECTRVAEQAAVEVAEATDALRQAEQALAAIQAEERALAPEIDEARQLDRKLADLNQTLAELVENRTRLALEMNAAQTQAETADSALRDAETQRAEHAAWLETHRYLARWEAQEAELVGQLREYGAVAEKLTETEQLRLKADTANREAQARLAEAAAELARQEAQHRQAEADLADARAVAPGEEAFSALMEKKSRLQALQGLYANWQAKLVQVQQAADRHAGLLKEADTAAQELRAAEALHAEISAELPVLQGMLEEARRTQRLVEAASGSHAELLRETLVDGEPCPVCGSRHHEQEALHAYVGAQVEEARSRTRELEADSAGRQQELAGLAERIKHTGVRCKQVQAQAEAEAQAVNDATREAEALREQIAGEAANLGLGADEDGLGQQISACLKEADDACRCAVEGRKKAAEAHHAEEAARAKLEKARATRQVAEEQARQTGQQQERLQETVVRLREEQERLANALNRVLGEHLDWQQQSDAVAAVQQQISSWRARDEACRATEEALPALRQQLEDARAGASAAQARLDEVSTRCVDAGSERDRLNTIRGGLLSGATVADVAARLEEAGQAANARLEAARAREAAGMQNQAVALTRQQETARRCEELEEQVRQRCEDLHARLEEAGLDEAEVGAAARTGREALLQEAEALAALDAAVIRAQAAVASRREDVERHDASDQPGQTDEELAAEVVERSTERQVVQERLKGLEFDLRRDDEVRAHTAVLRAELERRREEARPWLELNEVIGDREGKRFRKFAQGLTLDRLLEHANARLAELSPRYTLERGQGGDMMIQVVDHDMAGEVRGVHNLSGGERFLVSLALALGLAEMSTGRGLRVESLFIDEGFGALDSASLGQALSVLEHLHASGRRVGVISHVEEVKERIPVQVMVTPIAKGRSQVEVGAA